MFILIIFLIILLFVLIDSLKRLDEADIVMSIIGILIITLFMTLFDYLAIFKTENEMIIQYENLYKEGLVIEKYTESALIKTEKNIVSLENNNQSSTIIQKKMDWINLVKHHNSKLLEFKWRHENPIFYFIYGQTPFKSIPDIEKYIIEIK